MNDMPHNSQVEMSEAEAEELMRSLLHKQGSWVEWGQGCQKLQQAGYSSQKIFEATGFQNSQQNLVIVAAQVFDNLARAEVAPEVLDYFRGPRSDVLYEFRVLNQQQRVDAGLLAYDTKIDLDGAQLVARAIKDVSRMSQLPESFTNHPGDWVAYLSWRRAKSQKDLQQRSRLIAQGLKFAHSTTARQEIEKLLSDFTVVKRVSEPLLPLYRLELEEELPRIVPLAGAYPLSGQDISAIEPVEIREPFSHIEVSGGSFIPVPGWQAILKAAAPVAYLCPSNLLPKYLGGKVEQVLVILDRGNQQWNANSYFALEIDGKVEIRWSETAPESAIVGQLVLILRPKKILDEGNITQPWQMDD